jgi:hypothetical protein
MIVNIISYKRNKKTTGREIKKMMKLKKKREWIIKKNKQFVLSLVCIIIIFVINY